MIGANANAGARRLALAAACALGLGVTRPATAATRAVSSLPTMPIAPAAKNVGDARGAGLRVHREMTTPSVYGLDAATRSGYCFLQWDWRPTASVDGSAGKEQSAYVLRLVEEDGKASLEKRSFTFDSVTGQLAVGRPVSTEVAEVARAGSAVAWAYRDGADVVLVARGVVSGFASPHRAPGELDPLSSIGVNGCPYGVGRLDAAKASVKRGAAAELVGVLPARGTGRDRVTPSFVVDASLAELARDPEPLLSVRVRLPD